MSVMPYYPGMSTPTLTQTPDARPAEIRAWLVTHDRTSAWLSRKLGISVSHLHRIVKGERPLTPEMAARLRDASSWAPAPPVLSEETS